MMLRALTAVDPDHGNKNVRAQKNNAAIRETGCLMHADPHDTNKNDNTAIDQQHPMDKSNHNNRHVTHRTAMRAVHAQHKRTCTIDHAPTKKACMKTGMETGAPASQNIKVNTCNITQP